MATATHSEVADHSITFDAESTFDAGSDGPQAARADEAMSGARFAKGVLVALGLAAPFWVLTGWVICRLLK